MNNLLTVYVVLWMQNYQMQSSNHFMSESLAERWGSYKGKQFVAVVLIEIESHRIVYESTEEALTCAIN